MERIERERERKREREKKKDGGREDGQGNWWQEVEERE